MCSCSSEKKSTKCKCGGGERIARKKAVKSVKLSTEDGMPLAAVRLDALAECDPSAGLKPLLTKIEDRLLFPLLVESHVVGSVTMQLQGEEWKRTELNTGHVGPKAYQERARALSKNNGARDFLIVHLPAIHHTCLSYNTAAGARLVCLEQWPSDPVMLHAAHDEISVLTHFKEIARAQISSV